MINLSKRIIAIAASLLITIVCLSCFELKSYAANNEEIIYNFLKTELGLNTAAACGVLANIEKESNFKNDLMERGYTWEGGAGYGICQWTNTPRTSSKGRRTNLVNWCTSNGYDYKSLTGQLYFLKHELVTNVKPGVYNYIRNVSNDENGAYNAGYKWCYSFEVPAGYNTGVSVTRGNLAKTKYWPKYYDPTIYVEIPQANYYLKNSSTGTYLNINGGKAANGQAATMSAKQNSNSFKFYASGSKDKGYYLLSLIDKNYALNPYSDTPGDSTKITLYKKSTDGTQLYFFEKSGSGYIIHNAYNQNLVLTSSGSNVLLKTKNGAANQVWVLESADTINVNFYRNLNSNDTTTVSEKFTVGVANQKFGYNTDGTGRYGEMNAADVGFGRWTNPGYKLLGWSTKKNATARDWTTYSAVTDNWIKIYAPSVDLYAVWQKMEVSTIVNFHRNTSSDDDTTVSEKFTVGVANQKFGYNTDGTGRYETMNDADVGFGGWTNPGYKLLGWSTDKNATASSWTTYSSVVDNWIKSNTPSVDLYAVWQKEIPIGDINDDKIISVSDAALLQKYLIKAEMLTETQLKLADMNGDEKVNVFDFIILKRELLKLS